jgi:hypothetical protein
MKTITETFYVFTYDELPKPAQGSIVNQIIQDWIEHPDLVSEGAYRLYNKAGEQSERLRTPWFFGEYIWEYCKEFVLGEAKQSYYLASGKWHSFIED